MLSSRIKTVLALWCLAEVIVFALLVHVVGVAWTVVAALLTSAAGITLLKRTGAATLIQLRSSFRNETADAGTNAELFDKALTVLAALALTLPGFVSDLVGLALLARPLRDRVRGSLRGGRLQAVQRGIRPRSEVIDLPRDQWREPERQGRPDLRP